MLSKLTRTCLTTTIFLLILLMATSVYAKDYIIYSIAHQLPMVNKQEMKIKDFYVNLGKAQGVQAGTVLDVYRIHTEQNPFDSNKRYNYKIKIGEMKVIHSDSEASIGRMQKLEVGEEDSPIFEFEKFCNKTFELMFAFLELMAIDQFEICSKRESNDLYNFSGRQSCFPSEARPPGRGHFLSGHEEEVPYTRPVQVDKGHEDGGIFLQQFQRPEVEQGSVEKRLRVAGEAAV